MHSMRGKRGLISGLALALAAVLALPSSAYAGPDPAAKRPTDGRYRLFAGNLGAITINRIYYGLNTRGEVGVDSLNSSTIGGGFWPKGTGNQYMFNSGLQVAGIIAGEKPTNPWGGDTTGGMFFDASGLRQHGTNLTELFNATNPTDVANWHQGAYVPQGDASEEVFDPLLRGRVSASQGDVWWMSWEGDPGLNAARPHPLGIAAEYRVMGWNYPSGNEDLIYLIITFYNITSLNEADYAAYRPGVRELLIETAQKFHELNNAQFNVTLPTGGYTIDPLYSAFAADPDVTADAGDNFASVNMPYAMGFAYHRDFPRQSGWTFSPNIFGPPFFAGVGFVGIKYLKSATGPGEIALYSNTQNGGTNFPDPNSAVRLFKYLSGTVTPADGVNCNTGDVNITRMCYIKRDAAADMRMLQSSTPITLEPGGSASIVVSYIHAAPVAIPGYVSGTAVFPDDPTVLQDADRLINGANRVDSLTGFLGFSDANEDGIVQQGEIDAVTGSLLGKAKVAQSIFDSKFLLPFSPDAPEFFLVPGDGQVTVVWRPSAAETSGDPYFEVASTATVVPPGGGDPISNALYDPNYRRFDVEGYRIYRGRADTPTSLRLIASYDYAGTTFDDYGGQVISSAIGARCAPEIGLTETCAGMFDPIEPGVERTLSRSYDISGNFVQVAFGDRTVLASGDVILLLSDTAVVGQNSGFPALSNTGVPFVYVDDEVRNGLTYFYAVTAFDVNSVQSTGRGNTSLESARITKRVVPRPPAGNYSNEADIASGVFGRNGLRPPTQWPDIDPETGMFSGPMPPATGVSVALTAFVKELLAEPGEISISLDSIRPVSFSVATSVTATHYFNLDTPVGESKLALTITHSATSGAAHASGAFPALAADPDLAEMYGGGQGYGISGSYDIDWPGLYYSSIWSRGCINKGVGGTFAFELAARCEYNGPRWFQGDNETVANPNSANPGSFNTERPVRDFDNVGAGEGLDGVARAHRPVAYSSMPTNWRDIEAILGLYATNGEYRVYWGAGGAIDSVIDLVHDIEIPFSGRMENSWGVLNASNVPAGQSYDQRDELTLTDLGCVAPLKTLGGSNYFACSGAAVSMSQTVVPGPVVFSSADTLAPANYTRHRTDPAAPGQGFILYIMGHPMLFELEAGVPAEGTEWTMRNYVGVIAGGNGAAGDGGSYLFRHEGSPLPSPDNVFSHAVPYTLPPQASVKFSYDLTNAVVASTQESLAKVHTVPDPYYVTSAFEATTTSKIIQFVNLPANATVRIYTASGVLVRILNQATTNFGGTVNWDVRNRNNQFVASGVYFYHVTAENGESTVGRMTIINYAQ